MVLALLNTETTATEAKLQWRLALVLVLSHVATQLLLCRWGTEVQGDTVTAEVPGLTNMGLCPPAQLTLPQGHLCCASCTVWLFSNTVSCDQARTHNTLNKSLVMGL